MPENVADRKDKPAGRFSLCGHLDVARRLLIADAMPPTMDSRRFTLEFATQAWAEVGRLPIDDFDELLETLEHFSRESAARLRAGAKPESHASVPIVSGRFIAECTFDDVSRRITVLSIDSLERLTG